MLCALQGIAQSRSDSSAYQKSVTTSINGYKWAIRENLGLFNAPQYLFVFKQSYGFPFWNADSLINSSIDYDGNYYDDVPLKYDLVNQAIITKSYEQSVQIALLNEKIKSFTINNHQFYKLDNFKNSYKNINTGFYDRLYVGRITIWAKRNKELKLSLNAEEQSGKFKEFDQYYIQTDNVFNLITEKANVNSTLKNNKAIDIFMKQKKMKFADNIEDELIKIAMFYEQLKN